MSRSSPRPDRREVLRLIAATSGPLALAFSGGCGDRLTGWISDRPDRVVPDGGRVAATRLGAWLDAELRLADDETLWRDLESGLGALGRAGLEDPGFRARVQEGIALDFERGAWIEAGGWILSRTEVTLVVLASRLRRAEDRSGG